MAGYDPKRPRRDVDDDASAPVDALLEAGGTGATDPSPAPHPVAVADVPEAEPAPAVDASPAVVDLTESNPPARDSDLPTASPSARSETPTAPAPDAGTANPAVVAAGLASLVAVLVLLVVWLRRRR